MRTFSCEIIAENSKFAAKKFANQNEMYFDKSQKEFKLGNSSLRNSSFGNSGLENIEFLRQILKFLRIQV